MSVPVIRVKPGTLAQVVDEAIQALLADPLSDVWYSALPRVLSYRKVGGQFVWLTFNENYVESLLSECVAFKDARGRRIDPPKQVVRMIFEHLSALGIERQARLRKEDERRDQEERLRGASR